MAEIHLGASLLNFLILEYHAEYYSDHYFHVMPGLLRQSEGYVTLTDAPGLCLEVLEEEIARHPPLDRPHAGGGKVRGI
jgi:L-alanine-DL-glutamate epimerase-like enolase superfamily enzyme